VLLGVFGAVALGRTFASLLFLASPVDPLALAVVAAILAATICLAALTPSRRAMRVPPILALRID
jgi:ABC-type lipoprotein release transport system permease subunit